MGDYHIGDVVTWTSQANGVFRVKKGTIVGIVPAGMDIWRYIDSNASLNIFRYAMTSLSTGHSRQHTSFLVAVSMVSPSGKVRRRQKLYWPRVSLLQKVE